MFRKITSSFIQFGGAGRSRGFLDGAGKGLKFDLELESIFWSAPFLASEKRNDLKMFTLTTDIF